MPQIFYCISILDIFSIKYHLSLPYYIKPTNPKVEITTKHLPSITINIVNRGLKYKPYKIQNYISFIDNNIFNTVKDGPSTTW